MLDQRYLIFLILSYKLFLCVFLCIILAPKPVRERLGLTNDLATTNADPKSSGDIRIKTLEEIRQEKAARTPDATKVVKERPVKEPSPSKKTGKPTGGPQVKTFSEILYEKRKLKEGKAEEANSAAGSPERNEGPSTAVAVVKVPAVAGEVRVKTLEEIRREKAARMQARLQETANNSTTSCEVESSGAPKRRILRINKTSCKSQKITCCSSYLKQVLV